MTTQIAVRLPEAIVEYLDSVVASGAVRSRAEFVLRALERERRHRLALQDVEILKGSNGDDDLSGLAEYAARLPRPELD